MINAKSLLPYLKEKVRLTTSDASRHLLCAHCGKRTKLNTLGDGRKKCTICGTKFRPHKQTEKVKLEQCAKILLCFCFDFSERRTVQVTGDPSRIVKRYYSHFRELATNEALRKKSLALGVHAQKMIELMPADFLTSWFAKTKE